jgi:hypothetical protein
LTIHREDEFRPELELVTISGEGASTGASGLRIFGVDEGDGWTGNRSVKRAGARYEVLGAFDEEVGEGS